MSDDAHAVVGTPPGGDVVLGVVDPEFIGAAQRSAKLEPSVVTRAERAPRVLRPADMNALRLVDGDLAI